MTPEGWGPYVWATIHLVCIGAPDVLDGQTQMQFRSFLNSLQYVIPCAECRAHLKQNLEQLPVDPHLASSKELFAWSVNLHNLVNQQLGKPQVSQEEAYAHWKSVCDASRKGTLTGTTQSKTSGDNVKTLMIVLICICIVAGGAALYMKKK
jgi:Erv1 / Alr family